MTINRRRRSIVHQVMIDGSSAISAGRASTSILRSIVGATTIGPAPTCTIRTKKKQFDDCPSWYLRSTIHRETWRIVTLYYNATIRQKRPIETLHLVRNTRNGVMRSKKNTQKQNASERIRIQSNQTTNYQQTWYLFQLDTNRHNRQFCW